MDKIEKKSYKLSVYLLKDDIKNFRSALKNNIQIQKEYKFKNEIKTEGAVIIGATKQNPSGWKDLIQEGVSAILPDLENSSNRALVFFKIEGKIFVLVFGFGKYLIKDEAIDREFGLRTVLNIVDPDKLLSMDKANLDELTVLTRTQTSQKSNAETFNIDIIRDLLRGITGEPLPQFDIKFGKVITGSEGINFIPKINFKDIPDSLKELKKSYESNKYKNKFKWIDNLRNERDPLIISSLTDILISDLKKRNSSNIHLAPPYLIEWESFEGFSYSLKGKLQTEFEIDNFYNQKDDILTDLNWDKLLRIVLYFKYGDEDEKFSIPFWRCINYQTELDHNFYVFALSKWYKVNKNYADELRDYVNQIEESKLAYIDCKKGDDEGKYCIKLANSQTNYRLLDRKLVRADLTRSDIEVCDVISDTMEFVHIKFRNSSATLSHLFAQGKISAYALRKDKIFRKNLRKKFQEINLDYNLIPLDTKDIRTNNYTITFALIEEKRRTFVDSLPFFSLLNFRLTAEELILLGYNVKVKKIALK
jgi:uncharacterized protein (TIGR04141 family)